jgi:hypothetical protein
LFSAFRKVTMRRSGCMDAAPRPELALMRSLQLPQPRDGRGLSPGNNTNHDLTKQMLQKAIRLNRLGTEEPHSAAESTCQTAAAGELCGTCGRGQVLDLGRWLSERYPARTSALVAVGLTRYASSRMFWSGGAGCRALSIATPTGLSCSIGDHHSFERVLYLDGSHVVPSQWLARKDQRAS